MKTTMTLEAVQGFAVGTVVVNDGAPAKPEALPMRYVKMGPNQWQFRGLGRPETNYKGEPVYDSDQAMFERHLDDDDVTPGDADVYASEDETPRGKYR